MSEPMISLSNVSKHFGALHVLKDVSFDIPRSQVFAFIGPSGAGKSTLVRALNALAHHLKCLKKNPLPTQESWCGW